MWAGILLSRICTHLLTIADSLWSPLKDHSVLFNLRSVGIRPGLCPILPPPLVLDRSYLERLKTIIPFLCGVYVAFSRYFIRTRYTAQSLVSSAASQLLMEMNVYLSG